MPPRAVGRRGTRAPGRDIAETSTSPSLPSLQKPNLPKLQGTPSARRQYTYGSGAEPLPSRLGQRHPTSHDVVDLGSAVGNALNQQEQMPPPPRPAEDPDQDELAEETEDTPIKSRRAGLRQSRPRRSGRAASATPSETRSDLSRASEDSYDQRYFAPLGDGNGNDARSFATESDVFGDATIASTPVAPPLAAEISQKATGRQTRPRRNLRNVPEIDPSEASDELASTVATSNLPSDHSQRAETTKTTKTKSQTRRKTRQSQDESEDEDENEEEPDTIHHVRRGLSINTPIPSHRQISRTAPDSPTQQTRGTRQHQQTEQPEEQPTRTRTMPQAKHLKSNANAGASSSNVPATTTETPDRGLFEQARTGTLIPSRSFLQPRHLSDRPIAINADEEDLAGDAPTSQRKYTWFKALPSNWNSRESRTSQDSEEIEEEAPASTRREWLWLLNPLTYVNALFRVMDAIIDRVQSLWSQATGYIHRLYGGTSLKGLGYGMLGTLILALAVWGPWNSPRSAELLPEWNSFPELSDVMARMGSYVPALPSFRNRDKTLSDLWDLSEDGQQSVEDFLRRYEHEFDVLKKAGKLHDASIAKLEKIVPKVVHMELRNGKPVIAEEFWHAIRDLIHAEQTFLSVKKKGNSYDFYPEQHWKAVASRLVDDPTFTSRLNMNLSDVEGRLGTKMTSFWDRWVKENDHKISGALGEALEKLKSAESDRELNKRLKKLLKEHLGDQPAAGTFVTRDEFLRHVKNEVATHRAEIRAELGEIQPKLEQLIRETAELVKSQENTKQSSMTREDITTLVKGLVRKGLADINLEAMARGKIHAHWDLELKNHINYFSLGAGAIIDAKHSSATYDPLAKGVIDDRAYLRGVRGVRTLPPTAALTSWDDEGDCWCAARELNRRGNPHGASLSVLLGLQVVPQHLVIEHILPGATLIPDARPLDIEVHAHIADLDVRERVRDFAATHFPDPTTETDWNAQPAELPPWFVKIGQFKYEGAELHDGVHVHRLSTELLDMRAETDQVIIRATSNYGDEKQTCFYRIRLYGHRLEVDE